MHSMAVTWPCTQFFQNMRKIPQQGMKSRTSNTLLHWCSADNGHDAYQALQDSCSSKLASLAGDLVQAQQQQQQQQQPQPQQQGIALASSFGALVQAWRPVRAAPPRALQHHYLIAL